uniref:C2 domain-containing protein n=1 Tax=Arabidopsis thaliana TaxID=3702 RepID=Q1PET3_ARATH|nr:C2 domain-containing protein [Arabidopsis thaliana]
MEEEVVVVAVLLLVRIVWLMVRFVALILDHQRLWLRLRLRKGFTIDRKQRLKRLTKRTQVRYLKGKQRELSIELNGGEQRKMARVERVERLDQAMILAGKEEREGEEGGGEERRNNKGGETVEERVRKGCFHVLETCLDVRFR